MVSLLLGALALGATYTVADVPNPQADHRGWVSDEADLLPPAQEAEVEARLQAIHEELGAEIALVTLDDVEGTPKAFATELFNTWKIGDEHANNGLLVLMVVKQRRLEIDPLHTF